MLYRKISSLFLLLLILNLNMAVPAVSYAVAEETCSCHLNNVDHQCHCEEGCKSCGMDKRRESMASTLKGIKGQKAEDIQKAEWAGLAVIKERTCSSSPQGDDLAIPVAIHFMIPVLSNAAPTEQVFKLSILTENPLYGVTVTPSEKPPTV